MILEIQNVFIFFWIISFLESVSTLDCFWKELTELLNGHIYLLWSFADIDLYFIEIGRTKLVLLSLTAFIDTYYTVVFLNFIFFNS